MKLWLIEKGSISVVVREEDEEKARRWVMKLAPHYAQSESLFECARDGNITEIKADGLADIVLIAWC